MKRAAVSMLLFLFGFILGALCLVPMLGRAPDVTSALLLPAEDGEGAGKEEFSSQNTAALLQAAAGTAQALKEKNYEALAGYIHPEQGVTFTPYSTVDQSADRNFTADQIRALAEDDTRYLWGYEDGQGAPIEMTIQQFLDQYIFAVDYTLAPRVGVDEIVLSGNSLENVREAYPGCRFVDLCYPGLDQANGGLDWCSLKMVFAATQSGWYLVGLIHSQWTI